MNNPTLFIDRSCNRLTSVNNSPDLRPITAFVPMALGIGRKSNKSVTGGIDAAFCFGSERYLSPFSAIL
jgi:hypothetical protein